jgi:hypothetical protein
LWQRTFQVVLAESKTRGQPDCHVAQRIVLKGRSLAGQRSWSPFICVLVRFIETAKDVRRRRRRRSLEPNAFLVSHLAAGTRSLMVAFLHQSVSLRRLSRGKPNVRLPKKKKTRQTKNPHKRCKLTFPTSAAFRTACQGVSAQARHQSNLRRKRAGSNLVRKVDAGLDETTYLSFSWSRRFERVDRIGGASIGCIIEMGTSLGHCRQKWLVRSQKRVPAPKILQRSEVTVDFPNHLGLRLTTSLLSPLFSSACQDQSARSRLMRQTLARSLEAAGSDVAASAVVPNSKRVAVTSYTSAPPPEGLC